MLLYEMCETHVLELIRLSALSLKLEAIVVIVLIFKSSNMARLEHVLNLSLVILRSVQKCSGLHEGSFSVAVLAI